MKKTGNVPIVKSLALNSILSLHIRPINIKQCELSHSARQNGASPHKLTSFQGLPSVHNEENFLFWSYNEKKNTECI